MKKFFTLAAAVLASFSLWAAYPTATTTYALEDLTVEEATLTYSMTGLSGDAQKLNKVLYVQVEVPCASANGKLYLCGTSSNTGRFATIWGNNGTVRDEARKVAMKNGNSDAIAFTEADILEDGGKYYIRFSSADDNGSYFDYKISGFSYVLNEECVTKDVDHVVETLTGAAVNGVALGETEMSTLLNNKVFEDPASYVEAPTVTFTVKKDTYYVGEETPSTKSKNIDVKAQLAANMWTAQITVNNETTYTIKATKPETRTITFMDGETVLGTEVVAKGDPSTKHANFEVLPLAKFEGWFSNPDFTTQIDIESYAINEDQTLYGKFTKAYAQSLNIEQLVLDNGKGAKIDSILTARGYEFANINQLDSLNDAKANRNEPYLGLKIKKNGGYIAFNVLPGQALAVKFGYGEAPIKINVNGVDSTYSPVDKNLGEFDLTAAQADTYIKISTTSDKTVVIKQIMIDEAIADVVLPGQPEFTAAAAPAVNGSILLNGVDTLKAHQGDTIMVTYTAASGYQIDTIKVDGKAIKEDQGIYKFVMPGNNVTVTATFKVYEETSFAITIAQSIANGNVSLNKHSANQGDTIIVTAAPYDGYKIGQVTYGNEVIVPENGVYFFIMPDHAVEVNVTFIEDKPVAPTYLVSISAPQNGTIEFADLGNEDHKYAQGDEVHLVITPAKGYKLVNANAGNEALTPDADGKCSFVMPGQNVTVSATFAPITEGLNDIDAAAKAVKRLENGMLVIEKNGKVYNIIGSVIR